MKTIPAMLALVLLVGAAHAAPPDPDTLPAPIRAMAAQGVSIDATMDAPAGFKGYVGEFRGRKLPVYLLPDGKHVVLGTLYDLEGTDQTTMAFREAATPSYGAAEWKRLEQSVWIAEGATAPERIVYTFTDTECPFCHRLWQASQVLLEDSKTQIRHVLVAVISNKSAPRGAAILDSGNRAAALQRHEQNFGSSPFPSTGEPSATAHQALAGNELLMHDLGVFGTPALVYHDADGKVRVQSGVPDPTTLRQILLGP